MPASVLHDMPGQCFSGQNSVEELRAMQQVAMELSMLSLADSSEASNGMGVINSNSQFLEDTLNGNPMDNHFKGSSNTTECVPVPSSEHVAEIVGRQGCKIKALRAKTNTYIKTPVRGLEPVFVVTGRRQDVRNAKQEIMSAAEHFSQIRASRRQNAVPNNDSGICPPSPNSPGQVTIQVRVPYRVVGLVVGPKGATIKRIQQSTHTYIVTPSRDKEPVFEVMGTVECVEKARKEIESHIAMRTGGVPNNSGQLGGSHHIMDSGGDNSVGGAISDFQISGIDSGFNDLTASAFGSASSLLQSQQQHSSLHSAGMVNQRNTFSSSALGSNQDNMFTFPSSNINSSMVCSEKMMSGAGSNRSNGIGSSFSAFTATANNSTGSGFMSSNGMGAPSSTQFGLYDSSDEGIGSPSYGSDMASLCSTTPSLWSDGLGSSSGSGQHPLSGLYGPNKPPNTLPLGSRRSNSLDECTAPRMSPTVDGSGLTDHSSVRRICSDPRTGDASLAAFELTAGGTSGGVNTGLTGLLSRDVSLTGGSTSGCSSASSSPVDLLPRGIGAPSHNFPTPPSSRMTPPTLARMTPPPQMARMTPPPLLARMTPPPLARGTTPPMSARSAPMSARSATPSGPSPARTPPQACNACNESPVAAALVPCGHNSFCLDCANQVVNKPAPHERCCPICMQPATQAVRIIS